jgi:hypothetical protein
MESNIASADKYWDVFERRRHLLWRKILDEFVKLALLGYCVLCGHLPVVHLPTVCQQTLASLNAAREFSARQLHLLARGHFL